MSREKQEYCGVRKPGPGPGACPTTTEGTREPPTQLGADSASDVFISKSNLHRVQCTILKCTTRGY